MLNRSLGWMLVVLGLGAFHPIGASAQGDPSTPLPAGATACKFAALVKDSEPGGRPSGMCRSRTDAKWGDCRPATAEASNFPKFR